MEDFRKNGSGYNDPTAYNAIKNVEETKKKVSIVIKTLQSVAHLAGYSIEGRIVLKDKETGEIWR